MDSECTVIVAIYSEHNASQPCSTPCVFYVVGSDLVCRQPKDVKQKMRCVIINKLYKL